MKLVLSMGYSNIVKLLVEISVLKHAMYTKTVTSKCEPVIQKCYTEKIKCNMKLLHEKCDMKVLQVTVSDICKLDTNSIAEREL